MANKLYDAAREALMKGGTLVPDSFADDVVDVTMFGDTHKVWMPLRRSGQVPPWPFGTILRPSRKRLANSPDPEAIAGWRILVVSDRGNSTFAAISITSPHAEVQRGFARNAWEPDEA